MGEYAAHAVHAIHAVSELGVEKRCLACRQFWPSDSEFFAPQASSRDGLSARCRACIAERFWGFRPQAGSAGWG